MTASSLLNINRSHAYMYLYNNHHAYLRLNKRENENKNSYLQACLHTQIYNHARFTVHSTDIR